MRENILKKYIGIFVPTGMCNFNCEYCYIGKNRTVHKIPYSLEQIRQAFSAKRLGGCCLINICSDGETLIGPMVPQIVELLLREGHYVMIVNNGTISKNIDKCLAIEHSMLNRIFFKFSFHYKELKRLGLLDVFFENVNKVKNSPASFTVEYTTNDDDIKYIEDMKKECIDNIGAIPHINIPRDESRKNLGVYTKYSFNNYVDKYNSLGVQSEFFRFKEQFIGKRYRDYCYAGSRFLWINLGSGYSYQCYGRPPLQKFMEEYDKPIRWFTIGNNCSVERCCVDHAMMTLGVAEYPKCTKYKTTYDILRNRKCSDGSMWVKPTYVKAFRGGVYKHEHSAIKKKMVNMTNRVLAWKERKRNEL